MIKTILLPVDLNHQSSWARTIPQAVDLARLYGAVIHALAVIPDFGMSMVASYFPEDYSDKAKAEAERALADLVAREIPEDVEVVTHVLHGPIYREIIAAADSIGADLILMASHRSEMKDYLLGPNAARVVRHARQSVMVIRE